MTIRLFDQDPAMLVFSAQVLSCQSGKGGYEVELDQTAFFPEGGGQGADHGLLNESRVLDVHDHQGTILHLVDTPLPVGCQVTGQVDAQRRLAMSQQHSGEHILTGIIHGKYGYDNVGFHIGTDAVTVDFNGPLTEEQIREAELLANQVIWKNTPIHAWFPDRAELETIAYRSKKAIDGAIRIVSVEGVDTCACCGTHMATAGGVGQIKVINWMNYKGGVRLFILCGVRALEYEDQMQQQMKKTAQALSVKSEQLCSAVERLKTERDGLKSKCDLLSQRVFDAQAAMETGAVRLVNAEWLDSANLRRAASQLAEGAVLGGVIIPRGNGWSYALCAASADVRPVAKELASTFGGKGGGTADMVQGVLNGGTESEIRQKIEEIMG